MLPAKVGAVDQCAAKKLMNPMKPKLGNVQGMTTSTRVARSEEVHYVPIAPKPPKPCNIVITNMVANKTDDKNGNLVAKTNLQPINIVQTHNNGQATIATPYNIQFLPTSKISLAPVLNGTQVLPALTMLTPTVKTGVISPPTPATSQHHQQQPVLVRPIAPMTKIPAQNGIPVNIQSLNTTVYANPNINGSQVSVVAAPAAMPLPANITALVTQSGKRAASTAKVQVLPHNSTPRAPVILSKAAADQIRMKIGQAKNNGNNVLVTKALNNNNIESGKKATTGITAAAKKGSLPPAAAKRTKPEKQSIKKSAPAAVTVNAAVKESNAFGKPDDMPVVTINPAEAEPHSTHQTTESESLKQFVSNKMSPSANCTAPELCTARTNRSKSFVAGAEVQSQVSNSERRHSVSVMAKAVHAHEEQTPIETITIDDDDSDEDMVMPAAEQKPATLETARKTSTSTSSRSARCSIASSSDVEEVFMPAAQAINENKTTAERTATVVTSSAAMQPISIIKAESLPLSKEDFHKSLQCDEQISSLSPSSASTKTISQKSDASAGQQIKAASFTRLPIDTDFTQPNATLTSSAETTTAPLSLSESSSTAAPSNYLRQSLQMQELFGMIQWQQKNNEPAAMQSSKMRFELNRFNLLQLHERCEPRQGPSTYFEQALFDRPLQRPSASTHPLLYLCKRCNCHGPASDFLAPRFCSLCCVRRGHKRRLSAAQNAVPSKTCRTYADEPPKHKHRKKLFRWTEYLDIKGNGNAAPIHLFLNPFPISPNGFERGMKLEAIDPENCSLFCVCTIVDVRGYRLKLSFDGYATMYDFWVNADSMDIFPPGWCEHTERVLQPPKGYSAYRFYWQRYLVKTNSIAAPHALFTHLNMLPEKGINGFSVGMHIEAEDLNDTGKICVATVADILDERIRVHFDGWDDCYDFWVHVNSPYIHPCGWHHARQKLIVPPNYQNTFNWSSYIKEVGGIAAPAKLFVPREPMQFEAGMKLEVVDQRNPCLIRPATVVTRKGYRVQLHLDCWPTEYYFWLEDDSPDLHPIGWCEATSHDLEAPPGYKDRPPQMPCDIEGCRGYGNAKRFNLNVHALRDCCPYAPENWRQWRAKTVKPPRVSAEHIRVEQRPAARQQAVPPLTMLVDSVAAKQPATAAMPNKPAKPPTTATPTPIQIDQSAAVSQSSLPPSPIKIELDAEPDNEVVEPFAETAESKSIAAFSNTNEAKIENQSDENHCDEYKIDPRSLPIAKAFVYEYGPQYIRNYQLWQKNSNFDLSQINSNPLYWTNWDVYEFVERALNSRQVAQSLLDEDIDGRALLMLGRNDLYKYLNLKMGPAVKLFSTIVQLRIAVVCKFQTNQTGFDVRTIKKSDDFASKSEAENVTLPLPVCLQDEDEKLKNGHTSVTSNDEEDVILDNEDFQSVKPLAICKANYNQCSAMDDSDVVMATEVLPSMTISTSS